LKLLFILPAIGRKDGEKYIGTWKMEPLTIAVLKALTPSYIETEFFDDRIENIDYDCEADLVAISVETYTASRAYKIARKFREKGKTVIMGGYHITAAPEEAESYADSTITGNAEGIWAEVLDDFRSGNLKPRYDGVRGAVPQFPDRSIYTDKKYLPITLIETGRGCPHNCEFCAITSYYCGKYTARPIDDIVAEIKAVKHKIVFFVDDNLMADRQHLLDICKAITPLKIKWTSQVSLSVARDNELLLAMKKSGCQVVLIGFESLQESNLDQMHKSWNYRIGERNEMVEKIHKTGIGIYATFVFGFDSDEQQSFDETLDFAMKHKFFFAAFNHLLPFPGTPLYDRLEEEQRMIIKKWWLKDDYKYGDIPYQPTKILPLTLRNYCASARRKFFSPGNILKRGFASIKRNPNPIITGIFFSQNRALGKEIDQKLNLPVGAGLDTEGEK
jgi:radical SAM superfamily enzyme YgiQ (UPF0313 family)